MQFKDIPGHDEIKKRLIRTVTDQRISSTQLFCGPEGNGAFGLAVAYCQYIACENKAEADSCGKCPSCLKFQKYAHADLHFSFPANRKSEGTKDMTSDEFMVQFRAYLMKDFFISLSEWKDEIEIDNKMPLITVYEASNIIRKLNYKSFDSEYKFLIMWMPERMNTEAANRLLKTFEEPFEKTLIIMVAEDYDAILKTILSRAQLIKIPPYKTPEISEMLQNRLQIAKPQADKIATVAEGNYNKAKQMATHGEDFTQSFDYFRQWLRDIITFNITNLLKEMDEFSRMGRESQKDFLHYALFMIRQVTALRFGPGVEVLSSEEYDFAQKFSDFIQITTAEDANQLFNDAIYHIERNGNAKMIFLDLSLTLGKILKRDRQVSS